MSSCCIPLLDSSQTCAFQEKKCLLFFRVSYSVNTNVLVLPSATLCRRVYLTALEFLLAVLARRAHLFNIVKVNFPCCAFQLAFKGALTVHEKITLLYLTEQKWFRSHDKSLESTLNYLAASTHLLLAAF